MITMKKISIILLSAVLVFSMAACNGDKEKADNQTEKQTESVKPKAVDADLSGPEEEREADDRMESAAIVAEDKGAYQADREGRTR